ncbi:hypothetical protein Mgra_00008616, partial [Meloidogyne graminicola]
RFLNGLLLPFLRRKSIKEVDLSCQDEKKMLFNSFILIYFLLLMANNLYVNAATIVEEKLHNIETNLEIDSELQEYFVYGLETLLNLFVDVNSPVLSDEIFSPSSSSDGRVVGFIRQLSKSASFNAANQNFSQTRSVPSSPVNNKIGKQFFRSVSLNTHRTSSNIASSSPIGSVAGVLQDLYGNFLIHFLSILIHLLEQTKITSTNFGRDVIIPTAIGYLNNEISALRDVLNEIYESAEQQIPYEIKKHFPLNLIINNYIDPIIINRQLISELENWIIRFNEGKAQENADLCELFYLNEKSRFEEQLKYLTCDNWFYKPESRTTIRYLLYNNDELENIVKKMRINLGKVAVKSYQIFWLYSIATLVCSKKLNVSYEEKIIKLRFDNEHKNAQQQKQALSDALENFKLIKTEWTDNKEKKFNEENKFTNNLQEAYNEWFNNLEIKGYNFRKIVKQFEWDGWNDVLDLLNLENEIFTLYKRTRNQRRNVSQSIRNVARQLSSLPDGEGISLKGMSPMPRKHLYQRKLSLDVTGLINKPVGLKISSLKIPENVQVMVKPKKLEQNIVNSMSKFNEKEEEKYPIDGFSKDEIEEMESERYGKAKARVMNKGLPSEVNNIIEELPKLIPAKLSGLSMMFEEILKNKESIPNAKNNLEKNENVKGETSKIEKNKINKAVNKQEKENLNKELEKAKILNNLLLKEAFKKVKETKQEELSIALPTLDINPPPVINPIKDHGAVQYEDGRLKI